MVGTAIAALTGCGSSPAKSNAPDTATAACAQLHTAAAARAVRCNGGPTADWVAYEASWDDCATYDQHVREGTVAYLRDKFEACVAEYDLPCDHTFNCFYEVLHGLVADGQSCRDSEVCDVNSGCLSIDANACGEQCMRVAHAGEACGLYCGGTTPCLDIPFCRYDAACVDNVCVTPKAVGAPCGGADLTPCAPPAFCTADPADLQSTGTCALPTSGQTCRADNECPAKEFCLQGTCAARRSQGAACADVPTSCEQWSTCDVASATCVPGGKPGLPCVPYPNQPDTTYCLIGYCDVDAACHGYAGLGESCAGASCGLGASCDGASLTCGACP